MRIYNKKLCYLNGVTNEDFVFISDLKDLHIFLHLDYEIDKEQMNQALLDYHLRIGKSEEELLFTLECIYEVTFKNDETLLDNELIDHFLSYLHSSLMELIQMYMRQSSISYH